MKKTLLMALGIILMVCAPMVFLSTVAYTMTLPRLYEAEVKLALHEDRADADAFIRDGKDFVFNPLYFRSQVAIMESRQILDKVMDNLALQKEWGRKLNEDRSPIGRELAFHIMAGAVKVEPFRDTSLIVVRVRMEDGQEAALVANEIVRVYAAYRLAQKRSLMKAGADDPALQRDPVEVIDSAQPSTIPVSPNLTVNILVAISVTGGFFLAGLISLLGGAVAGRKKAMPPNIP